MKPLIPLSTTTVVIAITLTLATTISSSPSSSSWQFLTNHNFTSQIQLHPHILLLLTLPWSGESRSLMNDISLVISNKPQEFSNLKLMYMHVNNEKTVMDSIGVNVDGMITVVYFHYSVGYKYTGRFSARNVLNSFHRYVSVAPEEVPFKLLNSPRDFAAFVDSADVSMVLVDFCGWIDKSKKFNGTQKGSHLGMGFSGENDRILVSRGKTNQKVAEEGTCKAEHIINEGFCEVPWLGDFTSANDGRLGGFKDQNSHNLNFCSFEEFERFHSFYEKFMKAVKELFLPPERHRFGLVSDRAMLSSLGVCDSGSWFAVRYLAGCSSCSHILKEEGDLNYVLQRNSYFVKELESNGHDQEAIIPANQLSILLFVDRSSDSSETRGKSMEALKALRVLAQHYHANQMDTKNNDNYKKVSTRDYRGTKSKSDILRSNLLMKAQKIKLNKKISSITIINEGKQVSVDNVASDLRVSSLNELLGYLVQQKKDGKLSSLAKDLGFQLLSDDIDIGSANTQQQLHSEVQSNQVSAENSQDHTGTVLTDGYPYKSAIELGESPKLVVLSSRHDELKKSSIDTSEEIKAVQSEESITDHGLPSAKIIPSETDSSTDGSSEGNKSGGEQDIFPGFNGSFFYSDGNYELLEKLTGACRIPSMVIVDPFWQQHYVYPEEKSFNFASLYAFLSEFLNGTLLPYQRSEHVLQGQREARRPPFVNLDFHEVDSIPRITAHTFSEHVIGFNLSNKENTSNAWNKDVLVLFSNSWCAFCQRMELIVREVYRAVKGYVDTLKRGSRNVSDHDLLDVACCYLNCFFGTDEMVQSNSLKTDCYMAEDFDYVTMKIPTIYLLDCTLNDCHLILKSVNQREVYPALVLFPAEKKEPLLYAGDMSVIDVMKFVAEHGSNFHHIKDKVSWVSDRVVRSQNVHSTLQTDVKEESLHTRNNYHEAPRQDRIMDQEVKPKMINLPVSNGWGETLPHVVVGSVLIATEKLSGVQPFDASKILIVAADQITGFQGVIINKHLKWSFLPKLDENSEKLKEAPLSFGGPVVKSGMPLLSLTRTLSGNNLPEILPGTYFLDHIMTIRKIEELTSENQPVADYWFFFGYSNWEWNQLYHEIAEGAWNLSDDGVRHLQWP